MQLRSGEARTLLETYVDIASNITVFTKSLCNISQAGFNPRPEFNETIPDNWRSINDSIGEFISDDPVYGGSPSYVRRILRNFYELSVNQDVLAASANSGVELLGNFSNTVLFRHYYLGNRKISNINNKLSKFMHPVSGLNTKDYIDVEFRGLSRIFNSMFNRLFVQPGIEIRTEDNQIHLPADVYDVRANIHAFRKRFSYVSHAHVHRNSRSIASIDISKFYDSITLYNIISHDLIYKMLVASFKYKTGVGFTPDAFLHLENFMHLDLVFRSISLLILPLLSYITHNGSIPTGMPYSPVFSNLIFASIDQDIKLYLSDEFNDDYKYTRYADDMCISVLDAYNDDGSFKLNMSHIKDIEKIIKANGFYLNYDKTKIMGPKDKKKVAGIIIHQEMSDGEYRGGLSIGSQKKLEIRQMLEGKSLSDLTSQEKGILAWVKDINIDQYLFICEGLGRQEQVNA